MADSSLRVVRFVARFDRREYWLAHEELEEEWLTDRSDVLKGLIQLAAAFVHLDRGNWHGGHKLLTTALGYLAGQPRSSCRGFDLEAIRARAAAIIGWIERHEPPEGDRFDESLRFELAPLFADAVPAGVVEDVELPYRARRYEEGYRARLRPRRE